MSEMLTITIDGRPTEVRPGTMLLDAMREIGVDVSTLCHHKSVEPSGACRLCTVEITHTDWSGWSGLVTSCLYPVKDDGLQVLTRSDRVRQVRTTLLDLYLSRCPNSEEVVALARAEGIDTTNFTACQSSDDCVQCGLCVRVCRERSVDAIAPLGRGTDKSVGPGATPENAGEHDCVGCLACAEVCPTGHIKTSMADGVRRIWDRDFEVALCEVDRDVCRACGACEEACPLAIPRVSPNAKGEFAAFIAQDVCVGCGLCAGACPTGAILQKGSSDAQMAGMGVSEKNLRGKTVVFACDRSAFAEPPAWATVIPVSCVGRVGVEHILECLARGADGVQLMCRDRETCPYEMGGRDAGKRVMLSNRLATIAGLGAGRVAWTRPEAGPDGPAAAVQQFVASLDQNPLDKTFTAAEGSATGLDRALAVLNWLREDCPELADARKVQRVPLLGVPEMADAFNLLYVGDLPELTLMTNFLGAGAVAVRLLRDAAAALASRGIPFRAVRSRAEIEAADPRCVIVLSRDMLPNPESIKGDFEVATIDEVCEIEEPATIDLAPVIGNGFRFRVSPDERRRLLDRIRAAGNSLICKSPYELLQIELLTRTGSWRTGRNGAPTLIFEHDPSAAEEEE